MPSPIIFTFIPLPSLLVKCPVLQLSFPVRLSPVQSRTPVRLSPSTKRVSRNQFTLFGLVVLPARPSRATQNVDGSGGHGFVGCSRPRLPVFYLCLPVSVSCFLALAYCVAPGLQALFMFPLFLWTRGFPIFSPPLQLFSSRVVNSDVSLLRF